MFDIIPYEPPVGWYAVKQGEAFVWYGPKDKCEQFVRDPEFREECLRSKQMLPGKA